MSKNLVGIELGARCLRMVQKNGPEMTERAEIVFSEPMMENGMPLSMDDWSQIIRNGVKEQRFSGKKVALVLPESACIVRHLTLPYMTEGQLAINLPFEFKDFLTGQGNNYYFDYIVNNIKLDDEGKPASLDLTATAIARKDVAEYRSMLSQAGLKLERAIPPQLACELVLANNPVADGSDVAVLELMDDSSRLDTFLAGPLHPVYESSKSFDTADVEALAVELRKAINFYNFSHRDTELKTIFYCGPEEKLESLRNALDALSVEMPLEPLCEEMSFAAIFGALDDSIGSQVVRKKQIIVSKNYPRTTKNAINLAIRDEDELSLRRVVPALIVILALAYFFGKYAVADRYVERFEAKAKMKAAKVEMEDMQKQTRDFDHILERYNRYSIGWMTDAEEALVPRTDMLNIINDELLPIANLYSINSTDNILNVSLRGISLQATSDLIGKLEKRPDISSITFTTARSQSPYETDPDNDLIVTLVIVMMKEAAQ